MGITLSHEHFKWESNEELALLSQYKSLYSHSFFYHYTIITLPYTCQSYIYKYLDAVVDASPPIGGQNLKLLKKLSKASDIHIIPWSGGNLYVSNMIK